MSLDEFECAYHESGHALIFYLETLSYDSIWCTGVSIAARDQSGGRLTLAWERGEDLLHEDMTPPGYPPAPDPWGEEILIRTLLAGREAQALGTNAAPSTGHYNDYCEAIIRASRFHTGEEGLRPYAAQLLHAIQTDDEDQEEATVRALRERSPDAGPWVSREQAATRAKLVQHRTLLDALATALQERKSILWADALAILDAEFQRIHQ